MRPRVIGLYGGSGAGKSSVARWLAGRGALIVDADEVSREVSAPGGRACADLKEAYPDCFGPDGVLDRRKLGARVFADPEERQRLERIVHPYMRQRMAEMIEAAAQELIVIDCAILLAPAFRDLAGERWLVTAPASARRERIEKRDQLSSGQAGERIDAQEPDSELMPWADRVIVNDGTEQELFRKLEHEFAREVENT